MKAVFFVLLVGVTLTASQDRRATLDQAASAFKAGDSATAEQILRAILDAHPGDSNALELMGMVLDTEKRYIEADAYYEHALEISPASAQLLNNAGNHYLASGNTSKARQFYEKAIALDPHHTNAALQLAQISLDNNQGQAALSYLNRLNNRAASDSGTLVLRARALAMCGRCAEARGIAQSIEGKPEGEQTFYSLAIALAECKYYGDAEQWFSRVLDSDPQNFVVLYNLGLASLQAGNLNRAQTVFERALAVHPGDPDTLQALAKARVRLAFVTFHSQGAEAALHELDRTAEVNRTSDDYLLRAQILDSQGKVTEAADMLNKALRVAPGNITLYYEAVDFLLKHKLYHETGMFLDEALRIRPNDRDLLLSKALTLNLLRRNADSEALLQQMETRWPDWDRIYLLKGMLLEIGLKSEEARRTLEKAISLGANTPEAYYYEALAITHSAPQDLNAAQNAITRALAVASDDPYIYLLAGKIALSRKDYATAVKQLLQATRIEPSLVPAHYALRHTYIALGDGEKAEREMQLIKQIANETHGTDEGRFAVEDFLFAVRPPG